MVQFGKFGSWLLLMIISFILVSLVHRPAPPPEEALLPESVRDEEMAART
jgi:hypothetical protein